jgi:hypothetical protein
MIGQEILELFTEFNPEALVIDLPAIRRIHRVQRSNVKTIHVTGFKQQCPEWKSHKHKEDERQGRKLLLKLIETVEARQ